MQNLGNDRIDITQLGQVGLAIFVHVPTNDLCIIYANICYTINIGI